MEKFIGCMVSLDCGEALGTYQGQVIAINPVEGSITIVQPYRNGIPFKSPQVTLRSQDIERLEIVRSSEEAKELPLVVNKKIQLLSNNLNSLSTDGTKTSAAKSDPLPSTNHLPSSAFETNSHTSQSGSFNGNGHTAFSKPKSAAGSAKMLKNDAFRDSFTDCFVNGHGTNKMNGNGRTETKNFSNDISSLVPSLMPANFNRLFVSATENKLPERKRTSSASDVLTVQQNRRTSTPRKADRQQQKNHDCFHDSEVFVDDFDFEKNLALFDKHAIFEEIERENGDGAQNSRASRAEPKYRCNENVLPGTKTTYRQINLLNGGSKKNSAEREFVTDSGLLVPSISLELRDRLFSLAENSGFTRERMLEMTGRSASEMILQLLGGNSRFDPRNSHQRPRVVVLCGTGVRATVAVNCARHLATRSIATVLFLSPAFHLSKEAESELRLYRQTSGTCTYSVDELPSTTVDMIVSSLSPHDASASTAASWSRAASQWADQNKARVLSVDPAIEGNPVESSWCLTWGLPLSYDDRCGQVYLCDLGLPQKLFKEVGIEYESPFAHKFVIPLHRS